MIRQLLLFLFLLPFFWQTMLTAQSATGTITVRATEYNISPEGTLLEHFQAQVEVRPASGSPYVLTRDCNPTCVFENLPKGSTLVFSAVKTEQTLHYINPFDLALINKHFLKLDTFDHPALLIAADADCNGSIDRNDIEILRKLILGNDIVLCRTWTLLDADVHIPDDPLQMPLPTTITLNNYNGKNSGLEFLAIKIGNIQAEFPEQRATGLRPGEFVAGPQPNPTRGTVWFGIQVSEPTTLLLEIFDTGGRRLYAQQHPVQAGTQQIELLASALSSPGLYFWQMTTERQQASGKLVRM